MLEFALSCTEGEPFASTDLLELHCGNANFTVINIMWPPAHPSPPVYVETCVCFLSFQCACFWYPSLRW
eukprot:COSAG01_NODE_5657_length_4114_cov_58.182565_6_plen_69_part_00